MKFWRKVYRWKKLILYIITIITLTLGIYYQSQKIFLLLPLHEIAIEGTNNFHFSNDVLPIKEQPIVTAQLQTLYDLSQESPWVKSIIIRRVLPYKLNIQVTEHIPFAIWNDKVIITKEGYEITDQIRSRTLLSVHGECANKNAFSFVKSLDLESRNDIMALEYIGQRRWNIVFNGGLTVKLPDEDYQIAWYKALDIISKYNLLKSNIKYLDMRLRDKIFIKMQ